MNEIKPITSAAVRLQRNEDGMQFFAVPPEFEMPDGQMTIRREGTRLVLEPKRSLLAALDAMEPLSEEEWPDITDDDLGPLRDIEL